MSDAAIEGACLCGKVRYRIHGEIVGFQYCHCSRCRKFTGSAYAANLFVRPPDPAWTEGENSLRTFVLEGEPRFPTAFCAQCGIVDAEPVYDRSVLGRACRQPRN